MAAGLRVAPLGPAIGALVSGIDLREPLGDAAHDKLLGALLRHHVLFFENQPVTPPQQRGCCRRRAATRCGRAASQPSRACRRHCGVCSTA
ncbi:TauD/TfdA family dioxygenase [Rhizobacter sp. Root29]